MNKLRHYLLGTNFTVKTDHSNLRWILEAHHIRDPQIARWRAVLSQYDFKLLYDKKVAVADALSRDARFEQVVHLVSECDMVSAITCAQVLSRDPRFEKPPDTQQQGYMAAVRCDTASGHERICKSFDWVDPEDKMIEIGCGSKLSVGAKHPRQSDSRIRPRACDDFDGFCVSCLQIWQ